MTFMGFVHNYEGLMAARWFLGLAEAGLFPGINYYLSCWYRRSEFGIRAVSKPYPWIEFLIDVCTDFELYRLCSSQPPPSAVVSVDSSLLLLSR